jgi:RHS repeat-associated protein
MLMTAFGNVPALARAGIIAISLLFFSHAAEGATGRTPGAFDVTPAGAAKYTIPLWTPRGAGGMRPQLSISYNHTHSNGILGMGFQVTGFSAITRCRKTIAQDGAAGPVTMASTDVYCLDGNRLRLTSGTYGVANSVYRTELETYAKVTALGTAGNGPASFEVLHRNGLIYRYGENDDSRIDFGGTHPLEWALSSIRDRAGNVVAFKYVQEDSLGSYRPDEINYATNSTAGVSTAPYQVKFVYETSARPDTINSSWPSGLSRVETKRLLSIDIKYGNPLTTVKMYVFSYVSGTGGRSLLDEVKECSTSTGDCLSPTEFTWTAATAGLQSEADPSASPATPVHWVDIDGDGRDDMLYSSHATSGSGTWRIRKANSSGGFDSEINTNIANNSYQNALPLLWNNDNKYDLLVPHASNSWHILVSTGSGFSGPTNLNITATGAGTHVRAMDLDGNGFDDLVRLSSSGTATVYVRYNSGASFAGETTAWTVGDPSYTFNGGFTVFAHKYRSRVRRADFDGDKREEFICSLNHFDGESGSTTTYLSRCNYSWFESFLSSVDGATDLGGHYLLADVNDDALTDIVWVDIGGFRILFGGSNSPVSGPAKTGLNTGNHIIVDYDGDGRDDLLAQSTSSPFALQHLLSTGTNFAAKTATSYTYANASSFYAADISGDAYFDVVSQSSGAIKFRLHEPAPANLLASAEDGFDVKATFTYNPMTHSPTYTQGSGATAPLRDVTFQRPIVSKVTATDGTGSNAEFDLEYTYEAARVNVQGRGFAGFGKRTIKDTRGGYNLKTEQNYLQAWPHTGLVASVYLKQSNGTVIRQTINSWSALEYATGTRRFPYIYNSVSQDRELNDTHFRTVTTTLPGMNGVNGIDADWGIVTDSTTTTLEVGSTGSWGGESKTEQVTHTLSIDEADWCVRPETTTVTNDLTISGIASQERTLTRDWDDAYCRVTLETIEPGDTDWEVETAYLYDDFGNVESESVTGAGMNARTTLSDWGAAGVFPIEITNPAGHETKFDYNFGLGLLTKITDPNSEPGSLIETTWTYDAFGRRDVETAPDGTDTRQEFVACDSSDSRVKYALDIESRQVNDTVMRTDNVCFDRFDRAVLSHAQLADDTSNSTVSVAELEFDALGRLSRRYNPYAFGAGNEGYWAFSYDMIGRTTDEILYTSSDTANRDRSHTYDGLSTTTEDFEGNDTTTVMTAWGDLERVTDAASGVTVYTFDAFSQLLQVVDPVSSSSVATSNTYNIRGMRETSTDTDMGQWTYLHNALGEVIKVRDANTASGWTQEYTLDPLGRVTQRVEAEGTTSWTWGNSATDNNIGHLASVSGLGYSEFYDYDSKARLEERTITITGDTSYDFNYTYDSQTGFLDTLTYPTSTSGHRFKLQYEYDFGALTKIKRFDSPYTAYWTLVGIDPRGNVLGETLGNGVDITSTYDLLTGTLEERSSESGSLHDLEYDWDLNGNLAERRDVRQSLTETFSYDALNRVTGSTLTGVGTNLTVVYDSIGNITSKNSVNYNYATPDTESGCTIHSHAQRHAVRKVGGSYYCYDKNGNMTSRAGQSITWTSFNLPSAIGSGTPSSTFSYGPDRQRFKQVGNYTGGTETTYYVGGLMEKLVTATRTHYKHQIAGPTGLIATYNRRTDATEDTFYYTKDHLGSIDSVTDASAAIEVRLSFDAFGARRDEADWHGAPSSGEWTGIANTGRRGYTVHEHLDNLSLIHMNGRVQDPALGRFLSADPFVPDWTSGQSYNRFSYVLNNPLTLIDPSGFGDECPPGAIKCDSEGPSSTVNGIPMDAGAWLWVHGHAYCPPPRYTSFVYDDEVREASMKEPEDSSLAADLLGGMIAPFRSDGCDPWTGTCLSPGELKDQRFVAVVTAGVPVGKLAAPLAGRAPIVIGENMARVKAYAARIGGEIFKGQGMAANRAWVQAARDAGRQIIDIGPDFKRRLDRFLSGERPDSIYYNMERSVVEGYENLQRVWERAGKFWGEMGGGL